ncbi:MAG: hypothetical protein ABI823_14430 [Bryobacteraceae bacterium]
MTPNLDTLRNEINEYLTSRGLIAFPAISRVPDGVPAAFWDTTAHPDFRDFVAAAEGVGARIILVQSRELTEEDLDDAFESLATSSLPRDEHRTYERRLKELRAYQGFTSVIELSFDQAHRIYVFEVRTEWYTEFEDILDEVETFSGMTDEEEPLGGSYFSRN